MTDFDYFQRSRQGRYIARGAPIGGWTPAQPVDGVSAHTWHYAGSGALFQEAAKSTPAASDGDVVGASENQGTDSHDIVQATAAAKPTLKLNILNGHPVFRCDGGDSLEGAFTDALSQPFTIFAVAKLDTASLNDNAYHVWIDGDDAVNRMAAYQDNVETPDAWSVNTGVELTGGDSDDNWNIWAILGNGASSEFWLNGVSEASGNAGAENPDGIAFGNDNAGAAGWDGDIAEVIIYDANLSNAAKNQVGNYLANKYALSWTAI